MARVLIVDDDLGTLEGFGYTLRYAGHRVTTARSVREATEIVSQDRFDIALIDLRFPESNGLDLLTIIRDTGIRLSVIVVTAFGSIASAVEAMRLGAVDYVEKPLIGGDILRAVESGLALAAHSRPDSPLVAHPIERWAIAVARIVELPRDPKTQREWGREVGAAAATLRSWCRAAGLSAKRSLDLGRLIRAVSLGGSKGVTPDRLLNIVDRRTINRLFTAADLSNLRDPPIDDLLTRQRLIVDECAVQELRRELRRRRVGDRAN